MAVALFLASLYVPTRYADSLLDVYPSYLYPYGVLALLGAIVLIIFLYKPAQGVGSSIKNWLMAIALILSVWIVIPFGIQDQLEMCQAAGGDHMSRFGAGGLKCKETNGNIIPDPYWK